MGNGSFRQRPTLSPTAPAQPASRSSSSTHSWEPYRGERAKVEERKRYGTNPTGQGDDEDEEMHWLPQELEERWQALHQEAQRRAHELSNTGNDHEDEGIANAIKWLQQGLQVASRLGLATKHQQAQQLLHDLTLAQGDCNKAVSQAKSACWHHWAKQALDTAGAGKAHKWSKVPSRWAPVTTTTTQGQHTAAPQEVARAQQRHFRKLWGGFGGVRPAAPVAGGFGPSHRRTSSA